MSIVVAAALVLAAAVPPAPRSAPLAVTGSEEFLWRPGYWYCAHFAANRGGPDRDPRIRGKTLTVRRSAVAEGPILVSARGTIAELPRLFALDIARGEPALGPVRAADVQCYHFAARRNLNAQIERQSGIGSRRLLYRGEPLAIVTKVIGVPDFAPSALAALERWTPPPGKTIYRTGATRRDGAAWPDECAARPGYGQFIDALRRAVATRDAAGLRGLFAADGRMRLNGIGGDRNFPDWQLDRPEAAAIWPELEAILRLGCASRGDRLILPFLAAREKGADDDVLIAVEDTAIASAPGLGSTAKRPIERGSVLQALGDSTVEGWTHVSAAGGVVGHVPARSLRSPAATVIVLGEEQGSWRIRWFGGNL